MSKGSEIAGIKALCFDVFGTVVDWRSSLIAETQALGAKKGIAADWEKLVDAWRAGYQPAMDRVRKGELPWTPLDTLHRMTLDRLVSEHGIKGLDDADKEELTLGWHRLKPWPDAVPGLARLKRRYIIATLSNGNVRLLVDMAKCAGLPWDTVLSAEIVHRYKPDPATYRSAIEFLGMGDPGAVMMVAAHNGDLAHAQSHGMKTAFVPRPAEHGPHQTRDVKPEGDFTIVARDFADLAAQMGA
ncbi:MAG TPA: haloacid dehalogenase type II [Stellaceae bacterium]|nr:haloacid dehalogenase type II [Stellaceae bacterium]